jgi:hypothetical protein
MNVGLRMCDGRLRQFARDELLPLIKVAHYRPQAEEIANDSDQPSPHPARGS